MRHYRRNSDEDLRRLERAASQGDEEAAAEWTRRMIGLGRIDQVPVGYLRYLDSPGTNYNQAVLDMFARNRPMRNAALSYWTRYAGRLAFDLHEEWAGPNGAYGPRRSARDLRIVREFAVWARVWVAMIFLQSIASGDDQGEAIEAHEAALLSGARVTPDDHETLAHLPRDPELDAMIVAMHG